MHEDVGPTEAIRRTLGTSSDPRVGRTRAAVAAAVHELSEASAEISVAAIVRASGISRASFYAHYAGLDELANALTRDAFANILDLWEVDPGDPGEAMYRSQRRLVDHYVDNRGLYTAIAAMPVSREAYLANVRMLAAIIEAALQTHPQRPADLDVEATARYIAGAAYGLIDAWLTGDVSIDDDSLVEHLARLLPPWFSGIR